MMNDSTKLNGSSALSKLNAVVDTESADFTVTDPTSDAPLLVLILAGPTHPARVALSRKYEKQLAGAMARANDPRKVLQRTYAQFAEEGEREARELELLMTATLGWKSADGTPADQPFEVGTMESLYRSKAWLRKQVSAKLASDEGFTSSSRTIS